MALQLATRSRQRRSAADERIFGGEGLGVRVRPVATSHDRMTDGMDGPCTHRRTWAVFMAQARADCLLLSGVACNGHNPPSLVCHCPCAHRVMRALSDSRILCSQFCGGFVQNLLMPARSAQRAWRGRWGQIVALANNFGAFLYKLAVSVRGTC